jgi:hypothetical protein
MLFAYTYVPHAMEKMQLYIDFIFFEVWCKAPIGLEFSPILFDAEPDLKVIVSYFGFAANAPKRGKQFYKDIKGIYELFAALTSGQIDQIKHWYEANNDIEKVCANDPAVQIARYADIKAIYPGLSKALASFFKGLYSKQLLSLAALQDKIGQIDEHYQAFMQVNKPAKCPFCGITDMLGVYHTKREAYDHYLPKGLYPFNSINFRNLVPACHYCNSSYKTTQDPSYSPKDPAGEINRRKAFYPYATDHQRIEVTINLGTPDIDRLTSADIQLTFGPVTVYEEIETWKEVYGIDERYKAKCCGSDAKDWLEQFRILRDTHNIDSAAWLAIIQQQTEKDPVANSNFLKKAFLEGCQRIGVLEKIGET